jgi:hypothetical protein
MLPRPNRNKIHKRISVNGGRELLQAQVFGYQNKDSLDNPGGGGGYEALFIQDTLAKIQENRRKEYNHILNMERRLQAIHEKLGIQEAEVVLSKQEKSHEGTNSNK